VLRAVLGRDDAAPVDDEDMEAVRGAVTVAVATAAAVVLDTCMDEGRGRFCTVRVEGLVEDDDDDEDGTVEGRGLDVEMVLLRFSPVAVVDVAGFAAV